MTPAPRTLSGFVLLTAAILGANCGRSGPNGSAKADCQRVVEISARYRSKLPKVDLTKSRGATDAARSLRDYRAKLDEIPVDDKTLNNLLVDYSEQLERMAKALDDFWSVPDSEVVAAHARLEAVLLGENDYINRINEFCQVEVGRERFTKDMFKP